LYGHRGKLLVIDLETKTVEVNEIDADHLREFIGGSGLACRILFDLVDGSIDPLGKNNPLVFMTGPFTGTDIPTGARSSICAVSPLTGIWGESNHGGRFGSEIKFAGYDGIIITGQSENPCYIVINDSRVEIKDAEHLWGCDSIETFAHLNNDPDYRNAGIARIGQAGENLIRYASIMVDKYSVAGRTGLGAVMGSKLLKAIIVKGTDYTIPVSEPEVIKTLSKKITDSYLNAMATSALPEMGTASVVDIASEYFGSMPSRYHTGQDFDAESISGLHMSRHLKVKNRGCFRCPIRCKQIVHTKRTGECKGPEYESIASLGSLIDCNDVDAVVYMNSLADRYGLDTIELGNTIAMIYYLVENGRLELDGVTPKWGDSSASIELIERIVRRDGIGDLLAEGMKRVAVELDCIDDAAQINGMSVPMHDMRSFSGMGVAYATSPRGACHMTCDMFVVQMGLDYEDIDVIDVDRFGNYASETSIVQDLRAFTNSVGICNFVHIEPTEMAQLLSAATGIPYDTNEMMLTGERIFTLKRLMNLKLGYDTLNEKVPGILRTSLEGLTEGQVPNVDEHLDSWYRYRDWDRQTGLPSQEKITILDLSLLAPVRMKEYKVSLTGYSDSEA